MSRSTIGAAWLALGLAGCIASDVSREVGARCDAKAECEERCLAPSRAYPGGFCSQSCADDRDCSDGALCVVDDGGVCLFACDADPACAFLGAGWACTARAATGGGEVAVCRGG